MIRKQVYLDKELERALKALAKRTGQPEAEHVRAALRAYVQGHTPSPERDPLLALVGLVPDPEGPDDVAEAHDRYLYGAEKPRR